jgi:hypothetical protein
MTREIPVRIISPLVTGTGPPIIFDLHGLHETRALKMEFASLEIMCWPLSRALGKAEQTNLFQC